MGPVSSGGAAGNVNNSSNFLTGTGATNSGIVQNSQPNLQNSQYGLLAPNSVNGAPFPSGTYTYGFPLTNYVPPGTYQNQYGSYAGQALPVVSTSSVDINIVDCPFLAQYNPGWGNAPPPYNPSGGSLAGLANSLANSTWAQKHPRQTQVLTGDSNLYNQINSDYGYLGGNYGQLSNQALAIQNQDITDAAQNGGFIMLGQQAQLNQEENSLSQAITNDFTGP
jgi:hypothetical protein